MIGDNIYRIRKQRGLTLSELAERALISKSYLSNIERNLNNNPSIHVLEKIASVLQVELQRLIKPYSEFENASSPVEDEWLSLIDELRENGIEKEKVEDFKVLIEFLKWRRLNKID